MKLSDIDQAYVVNLGRRPERYTEFCDLVKQVGFPFEVKRWEAVDGEKCHCPPWFASGHNAWGCYRSHLGIVEHALSTNCKHLLIFEDDVTFTGENDKEYYFDGKQVLPENLTKNMEACLAELPDTYCFFYLGGQNLYEHEMPPVRFSDHLSKANNTNRTHAYMLNGKYLNIVYNHLLNNDWEDKVHLDHWYGVLQQKGAIETYHAYPWLAGQKAGPSDINGKDNPLYYWHLKPKERKKVICEGVEILYYHVGYGDIGLDGNSGYEGQLFKSSMPGVIVSAHADARMVVKVDKPKYVAGIVESKSNANNRVSVKVNDKVLGYVQHGGTYSESIYLKPGTYTLVLEADENNFNAHTGWAFMDEPYRPWPDNHAVEILTNAFCPHTCPGCNQGPFMHEFPEYQYTPENAQKLVDTLDKYNFNIKLDLLGGEPMFWEHKQECADIFNKSPRINYMWIITAQDDEENIEWLKANFTSVKLTKRNYMKWDTNNPPSYLQGVDIWETPNHALWPVYPIKSNICCCAKQQGIRAAMIGDLMYPCIVARSLQEDGRWHDLAGIEPDDYFSGRKTFGEIGTYEACWLCVNNLTARAQCETVEVEDLGYYRTI